MPLGSKGLSRCRLKSEREVASCTPIRTVGRAWKERSAHIFSRSRLRQRTKQAGAASSSLLEFAAPPPPAPPVREPLIAHELIQGPLARYHRPSDTRQPPTVVLLHGILGSRRNMQGLARMLLAGFPSWQVLLLDLRCHGESAAAGAALGGPHSVGAAARDVLRLLGALRMFPDVLIGHSFGGKVVLGMSQQFFACAPRQQLPKRVKAWVLDAPPGEFPEGLSGGGGPPEGAGASAGRGGARSLETQGPEQLIAAMRAAPVPTRSRRDVVDYLQRRGFAPNVAGWAATNLVPLAGDPQGRLAWGCDLDGIEQLYGSCKMSSHWDLLAEAGRVPGFSLGFVRAERSAFDWDSDGTQDRIRELGHSVHLLRNSTHWVHASNPGGLFDILAPSFGSPPDLRMRRIAWEPPPPTTGLHL